MKSAIVALLLCAFAGAIWARDVAVGGYPTHEGDDASILHEMRLIKTLIKRPRHSRRAATLAAPVFMTFNGDIDYPGLYTFVTNTPDKCPQYTGDLPKFNIKVQIGEPFTFQGQKGWNPNIVVVDFPDERKSFFLTRYNRAYLQDGEGPLQKLNQKYNGAVAGKTVTIALEEATGFLNFTMEGAMSAAIKGRNEGGLQLGELKVQLESYAAPTICGIARVVGADGQAQPMEGDLAGWAERKPFRQSNKKGANWAAKWASDPLVGMKKGGSAAGGNSATSAPAAAAPSNAPAASPAADAENPGDEPSVPPEGDGGEVAMPSL